MTMIATTGSRDANTIIAFLHTVATGAGVTAHEIERATGVSLRGQLSGNAVKRARDAMFDQTSIAFRVISGRLTRLTDEEKVADAVRRDAQVNKRAAMAAQMAQSVNDYAALSPEAKSAHTQVMAKSAVIAHVSRPAVMGQLTSMLTRRGGSQNLTGHEAIRLISALSV